MRRLTRAVVTTSIVTVGLTVALAPSAGSALVWEVDRVVYNPPGTDTGTNAHLNLETVKIVNRTSATRDLKGYTLRDDQGHVYSFLTSTRVGAGNSVTVHTGRGTNTSGHKYWGMGTYVWNNTGDTATLRNAPGTRIDYCRWTSAGTGTSNC